MDSFSRPVATSPSLEGMNQEFESLQSHIAKRIKQIRRERGWSLAEFETQTNGAIKAVVLGSYERGTRAMSVYKLELIAATLEVPVTYLMGRSDSSNSLSTELMIDIRRVKKSASQDSITRFFTQIIENRGDWNGEILTLRKSDLELLALIHGTGAAELCQFLRIKNFLLEPSLKG